LTANSFVAVGSARLNSPSGSAPLFGIRAWGRFNGTANATGEVSGVVGGNISEIKVDRAGGALGVYAVTFTTPMPDATYAVFFGGTRSGIQAADMAGLFVVIQGSKNTTGFKIRSLNTATLHLPQIQGTSHYAEFGTANECFFAVMST